MKGLLQLIILLLALSFEAGAAEFVSSNGPSFHYPDNWAVVTKEQKAGIADEVQALFEKIGKVDLEKVAVIVLNPVDDDFIENINVVINQGRIPLDEDSMNGLVRSLIEFWSGMGIPMQNLKSDRVKFGDNDVISIRYDFHAPGKNFQIRQWQLYVPGKDRTYIVTCSAAVSDYALYEPIFTEALRSFRVDYDGGGFWSGLPGWPHLAVIGGIIVVFIAGLVIFIKR